MPVGKAGARNAALMAARIFALEDRGLARKLKEYAEKMAADLKEKQKKLDCL